MGLTDLVPVEQFKQDANDGTWHFGSIVMSNAEYALTFEINELKKEVIDLKERLSQQEGR